MFTGTLCKIFEHVARCPAAQVDQPLCVECAARVREETEAACAEAEAECATYEAALARLAAEDARPLPSEVKPGDRGGLITMQGGLPRV